VELINEHIGPIHYYSAVTPALNALTAETPIRLLSSDLRVLNLLNCFANGVRYNRILKDLSIDFGALNRTMVRLSDLRFVSRRQHKQRVTYTITTSGRAMIADINQRIIDLVHGSQNGMKPTTTGTTKPRKRTPKRSPRTKADESEQSAKG
jgi:DNA-binding HxlR family transcriptional regulator